MSGLRIIYMGTPDFAVEPLKKLVENGQNIVGVITAPDKPAGRGKKITQSAVKEYAIQNKLNVLQPTNLKDLDFINELKSLDADLQVVVAFRMLPEIVWDMPRLGTFNLHASLLPQYRGAAPINWAVINGETETGVTTFFIQHEIDTGNIIFQEKVKINKEDNAGVVHDKLMYAGAELVLKTVNAIAQNNFTLKKQAELIEGELKPAPKIFKDDCKINWEKSGIEIYNFIRGLSPYPSAWSEILNANGEKMSVKIYEVEFNACEHNNKTGKINSDLKKTIDVFVKDGVISINTIQLAGKKRLSTKDLLLGFKQINDYYFL